MIVILVLAALLGLIPAAIAQSKGHSFASWWIFGALLWIVALPCALALKTDRSAIDREAVSDGGKICAQCAEVVRRAAVKCRYCGHDFPPVVVAMPTPTPAPSIIAGPIKAPGINRGVVAVAAVVAVTLLGTAVISSQMSATTPPNPPARPSIAYAADTRIASVGWTAGQAITSAQRTRAMRACMSALPLGPAGLSVSSDVRVVAGGLRPTVACKLMRGGTDVGEVRVLLKSPKRKPRFDLAGELAISRRAG